MLDLCFTSHPGIIHQCKTVPGFSDHHAVLVEIFCNPPTTNKPKKRVYCYNRAGWISLREEVNELSRHYYELNEQGQISVEDNWNYICDNLSNPLLSKGQIIGP